MRIQCAHEVEDQSRERPFLEFPNAGKKHDDDAEGDVESAKETRSKRADAGDSDEQGEHGDDVATLPADAPRDKRNTL